MDKNTQLTLGNITHKKIRGLVLMDESEEDIRLGWDWGDYTLFQVKVYRSVSKTEYSLYPVHGPGCPDW